MHPNELLNNSDIENIIKDASQKIYNEIDTSENFAVIGLQTRGVELARRLRQGIESLGRPEIKSGILDVTFHRDDLSTRGQRY